MNGNQNQSETHKTKVRNMLARNVSLRNRKDKRYLFIYNRVKVAL